MELAQIKQFVQFNPARGREGPHRTAIVLSGQTLSQQSLAAAFGIDRPRSARPGQHVAPHANTLHQRLAAVS